jgi:hypothetical protein
MVSLEDEMKQKDKEAAVFKANHKYEMLLNIEVERIEKCKRTYENFHNFEVAVMKDRRNRILQKQYEFKVQKNLSKLEIADLQQGYQRSKSQSKMRANEQCLSSNNKTNSGRILNHTEGIPDRTNVTKPVAQPKNNSIPASSERRQLLNLQRVQYTNVVQYANNVRTLTNVPVTRLTNKPNSERDYFHENVHENAQMTNTQDVVKFPVLQSVSSSGKSPTTANSSTTTSTLQRHTHFSENLTETHVIHSRDVRTPSKVSGKKKSHRTANEDNLSPFDQYRLRLQESEQRTRKPKHHFTRAISAMPMDSNTGRNIDDAITAVRRARSADVQ